MDQSMGIMQVLFAIPHKKYLPVTTDFYIKMDVKTWLSNIFPMYILLYVFSYFG